MIYWRIYTTNAIDPDYAENLEAQFAGLVTMRFYSKPLPVVICYGAWCHEEDVEEIAAQLVARGYDVVCSQRDEGWPP